jgi:hypothetical protein
MDDKRFDELTKVLSAEIGSRRNALRAVVAGVGTALGAFGALDYASAKKKKNDKHNHKHKKKKQKKETICHCPDNDNNNCKTKKLPEKKAKKHLRNHPNDFKGKCDKGCDDTDVECNINRPSECCSNNCCLDTTSSSGGICAASGGRCCGQHLTGGYCSPSFPQCCGQNACCLDSDVCCGTPQEPNGYCCPAGQACCNSPSGCCAADAAAANTTTASGAGRQYAPRVRSGN